MIESAFVLPVFALGLCASLDLTQALYLKQVAAAAARAGAHRALQTQQLPLIEQAAIADAGSVAITAKASKDGKYIRVETSAAWTRFLRYPGAHGQVSESATMRVE